MDTESRRPIPVRSGIAEVEPPLPGPKRTLALIFPACSEQELRGAVAGGKYRSHGYFLGLNKNVRYLAQVGLIDLREAEKSVSVRVRDDKILLEIAV